MHISVNGVRLLFDAEGAKYVPDGPAMPETLVLLMLHGGRGADHLPRGQLRSCRARAPQLAMALLRGFILRGWITYAARID